MDKILIFGHKNPDTDTICSSVVYAMYQRMLGNDVEAIKLGELNNETRFVFDYLNLEPPRTVTSIQDEQKVILIDHNEFNQSIDNIENAQICEIIDHHRIDGLSTKTPILINIQPVGCSATIIFELLKRDGIEITKEMAILLLSAIISDSLLFKSPQITFI